MNKVFKNNELNIEEDIIKLIIKILQLKKLLIFIMKHLFQIMKIMTINLQLTKKEIIIFSEKF